MAANPFLLELVMSYYTIFFIGADLWEGRFSGVILFSWGCCCPGESAGSGIIGRKKDFGN